MVSGEQAGARVSRDIAALSLGVRRLWAKSGDVEGRWLSLPQHLDDAAAVAGWLYETWLPEGTRRLLRRQLGLDDADAARLVRWCAGVHDVGKAEGRFQSQLDHAPGALPFSAELEDAGLVIPAGCDADQASFIGHGAIGDRLIIDWLQNRGVPACQAGQLAAIAGAHHGVPPSTSEIGPNGSVVSRLTRYTGTPWAAAWDELFDHAGAVADADALLTPERLHQAPPGAQLLLTALVVMADWIASNPKHFPLAFHGVAAPTVTDQMRRAERGIASVRLPPAWHAGQALPQGAAYFAQRFHWPADREPNALQRLAQQLGTRAEGPLLAIMEYPMGGGKTEAALALAGQLIERFELGGVFFGAPTMATSDGILTRVHTWADETAGGHGVTSLFLAHSHRDLNVEYTRLRARSRRARAAEDAPRPRQDGGSPAGAGVTPDHAGERAIVHNWLSGRRTGLLADVVVGTVDQALMMSLLSRHMELRHLAFANKVVIIDEVHAYDAYMIAYLERTLEWLAAYGTPVILLSATLPQGTRSRLATAYRRGLGVRIHSPRRVGAAVRGQTRPRAYPGITVADAAGVRAHDVPLPTRRTRIAVRVIEDDRSALVDLLDDRLAEGGCAAVICDTVRRAQAAYQALRERFGDEVTLLHAQFIASDRAQREARLLTELGPSSSRAEGSRPARRIVVATQVIEQSLDIDFDLMVTDICPIDLLLQRAGRLHRHDRPATERPPRVRQPELVLRGITRLGDRTRPPEFAPQFVDTVYRRRDLLAACAGLLPQLVRGRMLRLPDDIDPLVQQAYAQDAQVPEEWSETFAAAEAEARLYGQQKQERAQTYLLAGPAAGCDGCQGTLTDLFFGDRARPGADPDREAEGEAQVRDTDPTLEVLLVQSAGPGMVRLLDAAVREQSELAGVALAVDQQPDPRIARALARSSIRLPHRFSQQELFDRTLKQLETDFHPAWQGDPLLRGQLVVELDETGRAELGGQPVRYDAELGLVLVDPEEGR